MKVLPYGEGGAYVDLEAGDASDRAARTHALAGALRAALPEADVVAGAGVVAVFGADIGAVRAAVATAASGSRDVYTPAAPVRTHVLDVVYDGPDLDAVAAGAGVSRERVVKLHAGREHVVELVGFLPGFAYMGPVDRLLVVPRRPQPRPRVPAQSVAIAGSFTAVYPLASPGGWNLLGRSLGPLPFDPGREEPFLFAPGDRVRFRPVEDRGGVGREGERAAGTGEVRAGADGLDPNDPSRGSALVITRSPGPATIQDAGRRGWLGRGMPPSGPLDPRLLAAANRAVGNSPGAAAIELLGGSLELRARGAVWLSNDGERALHLADRDEIRVIMGSGAVRYVAVAGGVDVPEVLGARATLLSAKVGGLAGRALRRGDVLPTGDAQRPSASAPSAFSAAPLLANADAPQETLPSDGGAALLSIDPGPHLDRFPASALDVLLAAAWRVSRLVDRTGVRLEGASVPRSGPDLAAPVPMRRGAVQITTDGTPIVLGPDHPTTGGYPVLAVVRAESFGALAQSPPGAPVRFRLAAT